MLENPLTRFVIQVVIIVWMMAIGAKLVWLQVRQHDWLVARAIHQQQAAINLSPMRGVIYDRNGNELARSVTVKSLYASPGDITDAGDMADTLSDLLDIDRDDLYRRLTSSHAAVAVAITVSVGSSSVTVGRSGVNGAVTSTLIV